MPRKRHRFGERLPFGPLYYFLGVFYLIGHGHIFEPSFATSMSVEIKSHYPDSLGKQTVGCRVEKGAFHASHKTVAHYDYRHFAAPMRKL